MRRNKNGARCMRWGVHDMRSSLRWLIVCCLAVRSALAVGANELQDAAQRGDRVEVKRLLEGGAAIDATDGSGETALYRAARAGQVDMVRQLLAAGANPRKQKTGIRGSQGTPLHAAVYEGHVKVARVLLEAGVDPNLPDDGVGPPLHVATQRRQAAAAKLLRSFGARPQVAEPVESLLATADVSRGESVSNACRGCHAFMKQSDQTFSGPPLWGVVGRKKAGASKFKYSGALRRLGGTWTYADLGNYLADPRGFVPGTTMSIRGIPDRDQRAALIAYLRTLSDAPKPLP